MRDWRLAILICAVSGVARLLVAALTPLFPDETYYWEWSRHLAAGYFDHPPAVAWLVAGGRELFGDTPLGVRFGCVAAGVLAAILLSAAARRRAGDRAALLAATVFALMPLSAAGLVLATPDAPLLAAAAAAWYAVIRALEASPASFRSFAWWCAAGVALGFAITSKYTGVLLPFGILVAFVAHAPLRARLREPGPYGAVLLAIVVFLPVLEWNAQHDWISLSFQLRHGLTSSSGSIVGRELELIGGQAGLVSPVLFTLCVIAVWRGLREEPPHAVRRLLAISAMTVFAFFMYSATKRRVEANWPALAYLPAILLLVSIRADRRFRRWTQIALGLAALLTFVAYANTFTPILGVSARRDPAARAAGWDHLANALPAAGDPATHTWYAADRYQDASELAFHLPGQPATFSLNMDGRPNQYDLWPSFVESARPGQAMVLVLDDVAGTPAQITTLAPHFTSVGRGDQVPLARDGDVIKNFRVWTLLGWRGTWPKAELRSRS